MNTKDKLIKIENRYGTDYILLSKISGIQFGKGETKEKGYVILDNKMSIKASISTLNLILKLLKSS
jgi:hypothetical protein